MSILVVDPEDKLEDEPNGDQTHASQDPCQSKCCPKNADVDNESEDMNEKSKEDFSVEEKERDTTEEEQACSSRETASFRVVWNKKNYEVTFPVDETADSLKQHIENLTGLLLAFLQLSISVGQYGPFYFVHPSPSPRRKDQRADITHPPSVRKWLIFSSIFMGTPRKIF